MEKFYITGLYHTETLNDATLPAIEVEGSDPLDALTRIGVTVWTEGKFLEIRKQLKDDGIDRPKPVTPQGVEVDLVI